jgi:osmoprotectant transport system ATP-binding protein
MIIFDHVSKSYPNGVHAVSDLSLEIQEGELIVLLGTSGSGKTTAMKMINRLVEITSGKLLVDGIDVREHDPIALRRMIGYAVQFIGLFPHLSIEENIAMAPSLMKWPQEKIKARVFELLEMVGLAPKEFLDRYPVQLSGGQKQRIGVARALAADPPIVLMDEPFGALDPITREGLQDEFLKLQQQLKKTIIFVTHDIMEAVKLADRIVLLDQGKLMQLGTPKELVLNPNQFTKQFIGPQRFQLSLEVRKLVELKDMYQNLEKLQVSPNDQISLSLEESLATAVALFDSTDAESIALFDQENYLGDLKRKQMAAHIMGEQ